MSADRCEVLLVGCEHFGDWDGIAGRPDVLAPQRQAELASLVGQLAQFAPSKVAVEVMPERQEKLDQLRSNYGAARAKERSEVTQVGVRLAEETGATIHAIDADWTLDWQGVTDFLDSHPEHNPPNPVGSDAQQLLDNLSVRRHDMTVTELLREINGDEMAALNDRSYLDIWLPIGTEDNWSGVDLVASWYRRNLRILANLRSIVAPGDRVVVVFGLGHTWSLKHFLDTSSFFRRVPLEQVLG